MRRPMELSLRLKWTISDAVQVLASGGVLPSEFSIIFGVFPSITATAEFVVPR